MGRPINKKWFGDASATGAQFELIAKVPGKAVGTYSIVKQRGTKSYNVKDDEGNIHTVFLVDKANAADLLDGEASLVASLGGQQYPVKKLTGRKLVLFSDDANLAAASWTGVAEEGAASVFSATQQVEELEEQGLEIPQDLADEAAAEESGSEPEVPQGPQPDLTKVQVKVTEVGSNGEVVALEVFSSAPDMTTEDFEPLFFMMNTYSTGGTGTGALIDCPVWERGNVVAGALTILEAGTGYEVNDILTLVWA